MTSRFRSFLIRTWPVGGSLALHALILFGVIPLGYEAASYGVDSGHGADSITTLQAEVQLTAPPPEPEEPSSPPEPEKIQPEPEPAEEPVPVPEPEPEPKPEPKPVAPKPKPVATPAKKQVSGQPQSSPSPSRTRVMKSVDYLRNPPPSYPSSAKRRGIEGTVTLSVDISASGRAERVRIRRSSGHSELDQAALSAVKRWRFRPARFGGKKVSSRAVIPIVFQLD